MPIPIGKRFEYVQRESGERQVCEVIENDTEKGILKMQIVGSEESFDCHISELGPKYKPCYSPITEEVPADYSSDGDDTTSLSYSKARTILKDLTNAIDGGSMIICDDKVGFCKKELKTSLSLAIELLDHTIQRRELAPFHLSDEQIEMVEISDEPVSLNRLVTIINARIDSTTMREIGQQKITKWLIHNGFLEEKIIDGRVCKISTEDGEACGIVTQRRTTLQGNVVMEILYRPEAQRLIVKIINDINEGTRFV